jgi:hypothetical protein
MSAATDLRERRPRRRWLWAAAAFLALFVVFAIAWTIKRPPRVAAVRSVAIRPAPPPKSVEELLAPLPEASSIVRERGAFDSLLVGYELQKAYPANDVIEQMSSQLKTRGWHPLEQDWLSPGLKLSQVTGWRAISYVTNAGAPRQQLRWQTQWQNDAGDLVDYNLTYASPRGAPPAQQTLSVLAIWYPAARRAEMRRSIETMRWEAWRHRLTAWLPKWLGL